ncbi:MULTISPECIES: hypothetical protein [Bacillus]|uniref:Uncharacterized protein n=1 Tax=Bacillus pseudomycoides TaxID=64104 RepID=A0A2H3MPE7_9BACI|nr:MULTISPECIES: hypothetical protein [Bacillus]AIK38806.1 hypothetical protein DJ92_3905 [Bacillus pseudomycoides]AJI15612.1 hypothetical protein BG07_1040 [Bacillus pseudomycoides]MBD5795505.1 hypothetical protein [Bacillus pseudomycoides]MCR8856100.1 hypothetical protein [Bacillus pseudomycoides]MDR4324912.1 hypothetical protein [Bacillus pseudomycoides]
MAVPLITYISTRHVGSFGSSPSSAGVSGQLLSGKTKVGRVRSIIAGNLEKMGFSNVSRSDSPHFHFPPTVYPQKGWVVGYKDDCMLYVTHFPMENEIFLEITMASCNTIEKTHSMVNEVAAMLRTIRGITFP